MLNTSRLNILITKTSNSVLRPLDWGCCQRIKYVILQIKTSKYVDLDENNIGKFVDLGDEKLCNLAI